jgi:hypothetical protein
MNGRTLYFTKFEQHEQSAADRRSCRENRMSKLGTLFLVFGLLPGMLSAQTPASTGTADGKEVGGYSVEQSFEFGYRFVDVTGNRNIFDTFIDQGEGPRLLEQSLSLRAPNGTGLLFDDLTVSSFGWGGDPENVARARMSKSHVYDFTALFRRDHNFFDYPLLGNPLNPVNITPSFPVNFSTQGTEVRRRMYDFGLTLFPQSKLSFRLGYSRNREEGPAFTSFHEGTDVLLNQPWNVTQNAYRIGVDFKALPKTTISYDQFLTYDKNDTDNSLASFTTFALPNGKLVEFGLPWNPAAGAPCATPILNGAANPACNGYFSYSRFQRVRTSNPTEQLTLTSNYFKRVNFTGRVSYSSAEMNSPYFESFDGIVTRTRERQFTFSGPASVRRVGATADFGVTVEVTDAVRISNNFRYDNWRIPGSWNSTETITLAAGAPATLLSPLGAVTTTNDFLTNFLGMKTFQNLFQVEYSPSKRFGVHVGYRLRHREVFKAEPEIVDEEGGFEPFEGDDISINEYGPLFNVWLRPVDSLRVNAEVEFTKADNFITRISPRNKREYRTRVQYKPLRWANFSATANLLENRNNQSDTYLRGHYRNYGFITTLVPRERFSLDLSYNYTDALQNAYLCYNGTFVASGTVLNGCPTFSAAANNNPNWIYSRYNDNTHFFSTTIMVKPAKKLTANLGYGITRTDGDTTVLNALQPLGTLQFTYHQPLASLSYEVAKGWSLNAYWNYDQYKEDSFLSSTLPRNFHDNRTVLSARYAF